jgi:hypothetical protein
MTDQPTACRRCGAPTFRAVETDVRAAALQAVIDAVPYGGDPSRAPPGLTLWQHHPRRGWTCVYDALDLPHRLPVHIEHDCPNRPPRPTTPPPPAEQAKPKETSMGFWDDPNIAPQDGDFIKFDSIGDAAEGRVASMGTKTFPNDKGGQDVVPQLVLVGEDGAEKTLTAGGIDLRKKLIEARPDVGDWVRVTLIGRDGRVKRYTVDVKRLNGAASPAAAQAAGAPPF